MTKGNGDRPRADRGKETGGKRSVSFLSSSHGVSLRHSMLLHSYRRPFTLFTSYPASTRSIRRRPGFTGGTEDEAGVSDRRTGITSDVDRKA